MKTNKKQLAKFGIFKISETGAPELLTARNNEQKPLMTFEQGIHRKVELLKAFQVEGEELNLIVRALNRI